MSIYNKMTTEQTHRYREQIVTGGERAGGRGKTTVGDEEVQTTTCNIDKQQDILYSTGKFGIVLWKLKMEYDL